ncbi:MAG: GIY-YIG nuclease family protein [candidate division WOR-3 bacterium]
MPYYVYILRSLSTGSFYIGHTSNLEDRLIRHNGGRVKYTRGKGPWELVVYKEFNSRSEAMIWESRLKKKSREEAIRLLSEL